MFITFLHLGNDIKSENPEEYRTVAKVGREKRLAGNPISFRIIRLLISYLISKEARLNVGVNTIEFYSRRI